MSIKLTFRALALCHSVLFKEHVFSHIMTHQMQNQVFIFTGIKTSFLSCLLSFDFFASILFIRDFP